MIPGLSVLLMFPLLGSLFLLVFPSKTPRQIQFLGIFTSSFLALVLGLALVMLLPFWRNPADFPGITDPDAFWLVERVKWFQLSVGSRGELTVEYFVGIDGLNATLLVLALLVLFLGSLASHSIKKYPKAYFSLYLLLTSAVIGTFVALDFFLFYLCFEFMLLPMYFLIGIWGGKMREYAAIKFFLYTLVGSVLILLVGIGLALSTQLPGLGHTFSLVAFARPESFVEGSFLHPLSDQRPLFFGLLMLGFAIKLPSVPLHTWLPDAHVQAPTPVSMVLAGILLKIGGYGMLRMGLAIFPETFATYSPTIAIVGIVSILYGGTVALGQTNFKKLIAYSSVSHMGFVLLGMASLTMVGLQGSMYQMISHGIVSPLLFFLVGVLYSRTGDLEINHYSGLHQKMPYYTGFVTIAFFASLGLPTFSGFVGELLVLLGTFSSTYFPSYWAVIASLGLILAATYYLWNFKKLFLGKFWLHLNLGDLKLPDMQKREIWIAVVFVVFTLLFGLYPQFLIELQEHSIERLLKR